MIHIADAPDMADGEGTSGEFDQLIDTSEVRQPPAVVRSGETKNVGSYNCVTSPFELIGDVGSDETGGATDDDCLHFGPEESQRNKTSGQKTRTETLGKVCLSVRFDSKARAQT